jgi:uncharacterized membrane protein
MQWLRKAILRAGGFKPQHDEAKAFASEREQAGAAASSRRRMDWYSFTVAFKSVLEGLEVAFIVIGFGSAQGKLGLTAAAAAAAVILVVAVGAVVRGPLERVPENSLKFVVGVLLTTFGVFWSGEGAGVEWPGSDLAILGIVAFVALVSVTSCASSAAGGPRPNRLRRRHEVRRRVLPLLVGTSSSETTGASPPVWPPRSPARGCSRTTA